MQCSAHDRQISQHVGLHSVRNLESWRTVSNVLLKSNRSTTTYGLFDRRSATACNSEIRTAVVELTGGAKCVLVTRGGSTRNAGYRNWVIPVRSITLASTGVMDIK